MRKEAQETIDLMKSRIGGKKAATASEGDKQTELWCRLVIIRFNPKVELEDQLNGIAAHLSDPEPSVKVQALGILGLLAENAAPKLQDVVKVLDGGGLAESRCCPPHQASRAQLRPYTPSGRSGGKP